MDYDVKTKELIMAQVYGDNNTLIESLESRQMSMEDKIEIASQMATIQAGLKAIKLTMNKSIEVEDDMR